MATTTARSPRAATPERWQAALQRAIDNDVQVRQLAGSGQWIATSARRANLAYLTDGIDCECEAAMLGSDPVCQHRAAYWYAVGALDRDPEPEPVVSSAPVAFLHWPECPDCLGDGYQRMYTGDRLSDWIPVTCYRCAGSGHAPASADDRPAKAA